MLLFLRYDTLLTFESGLRTFQRHILRIHWQYSLYCTVSCSSSFIKAPQLGQYFFLTRPLLLPHKEHEYTLYSIRRFLLLMLSHISGIHLPYLTSATLAAGILSMHYMVSSLLNNFGLSIQTAQERILTLATVLSMYSFIRPPPTSSYSRTVHPFFCSIP